MAGVADLMQLHQRNTSGTGELGVESKDLYRELHLVGDALAGRLFLGPKFEVGGVIVGSIAVDVMDVLAGPQGASEKFLHDDPVLVVLPAPANVDAQIAGRVDMPFWIDGSKFSTKISTLFGTEFGAPIVAHQAAIGHLETASRNCFPAVRAYHGLWGQAVSFVGALARAKFLVSKPWAHAERLLTSLANLLDHLSTPKRQSVRQWQYVTFASPLQAE